MNSKTPKTWTEVYPHGTKEGDEEAKFFRALSRNKNYETWRSIKGLVKESGLTHERVEQIINKYYKLGIIFQHTNDPEKWAYWENIPNLVKKNRKSIQKCDQDARIKRATN